jgi:hypothetical protein
MLNNNAALLEISSKRGVYGRWLIKSSIIVSVVVSEGLNRFRSHSYRRHLLRSDAVASQIFTFSDLSFG